MVEVADDVWSVTVSLRIHPWNKNYSGTRVGGSLYTMCDPFFVLSVAQHLGRDHIIWDKAAEIEFVKAVKAPVFATFTVEASRIDQIRQQALASFSIKPVFDTEVTTAAGELVARVTKSLCVRRKVAKARFGGWEDA